MQVGSRGGGPKGEEEGLMYPLCRSSSSCSRHCCSSRGAIFIPFRKGVSPAYDSLNRMVAGVLEVSTFGPSRIGSSSLKMSLNSSLTMLLRHSVGLSPRRSPRRFALLQTVPPKWWWPLVTVRG
jgi:hypothetical protein